MKEIVHPSPTRKPVNLQKYGGQWVAILRREIIDSDKDIDRLCDRLALKGIEQQAILMKVPRPGASWV